jgi:hypothetical protein
MTITKPNPTLKFAPFGRWDAPSARPLAARYAAYMPRSFALLSQERNNHA